MKVFEMIDEENGLEVGILLYYEKSETFVIELQDDLDEWKAPLLFSNFVKKNIYTIPRDASRIWVQERIIPSGRQNIQAILANHRLKKYDEMKFLELSNGRCSQDSLYIKRTDDIPDFVKKRMYRNLKDCVICGGSGILCFFQDGIIRKIDLKELSGIDGVDKVLKNREIFSSGKISAGGYSLTFNDTIDIPAAALYSAGVQIPLEQEDFFAFVRNNALDTAESCEILECSRQNLAYLVKQEKIEMMKGEVRGNLYLKGDVLKNTW